MSYLTFSSPWRGYACWSAASGSEWTPLALTEFRDTQTLLQMTCFWVIIPLFSIWRTDPSLGNSLFVSFCLSVKLTQIFFLTHDSVSQWLRYPRQLYIYNVNLKTIPLAFFFQVTNRNDKGEKAKNRASPDQSKGREKTTKNLEHRD